MQVNPSTFVFWTNNSAKSRDFCRWNCTLFCAKLSPSQLHIFIIFVHTAFPSDPLNMCDLLYATVGSLRFAVRLDATSNVKRLTNSYQFKVIWSNQIKEQDTLIDTFKRHFFMREECLEICLCNRIVALLSLLNCHSRVILNWYHIS